MARPHKQGIDYFSLDVNFLRDDKVRRITLGCGTHSPLILLSLLCNIYRDKGYYMLWSDGMPLLIANELGLNEGVVIQVVKKAMQVGFFCQQLFDNHKILTSRGIQARFTEATYKRRGVSINPDYWVLDVNNANNGVFDVHNPQSKSNQSKSNQSDESPLGAAIVDKFVDNTVEKPVEKSESDFSKVVNHFEQTLDTKVTPAALLGFRLYLTTGMEAALICHAINESKGRCHAPWPYLSAVLEDLSARQVLKMSDLKPKPKPAQKPEPMEKPRTRTKFQNYEGRRWDYDKLLKAEHDRLMATPPHLCEPSPRRHSEQVCARPFG